MIVPAAAPVIIPECRHTGVAVPRVCGAPRPIGWLPPLTPGLLAKPQPLPLPSFPPLAPPGERVFPCRQDALPNPRACILGILIPHISSKGQAMETAGYCRCLLYTSDA